jgi:bile acid:Na+ symporter, BASS family
VHQPQYAREGYLGWPGGHTTPTVTGRVMRESLHEVVKLLVGVAVPLAALATGLRAARVDPLWLERRPGLLLRALFTILVLVPVGAVLFLEAIRAAPVVKAGLTIAVVAIGIGPPAAFKRSAKHEQAIAFEIGLNVVLLMLAIVYLPAVVAVHGMIFHHHLRLEPGAVARVVLTRALGPLLIGALTAKLAPRAVAPIARYAGIFVQAALLLVVGVALIASAPALIHLGAHAWLTCAALGAGEILVGHVTGGPGLETRRVLAAFSAMRFPALALLLAAVAPRGKEFIPVILAYVITSFALLAVYDGLISARERRRPLTTAA